MESETNWTEKKTKERERKIEGKKMKDEWMNGGTH